ncbi:metallophosphatase family protein [Patescibacteria group bacterium]|nr:metallophosphatase family protein [Patescibacteria group bacterium]
MRLAIISDSHDNVPNLEKFLDWIAKEKINFIIHCGDLAAPAMLTKGLAPKFSGEIHMVHGNVGDPELLERVAKDLPSVTVHGMVGEIEVDGKKIAFTHFPEKALELAKKGTFDLVFYGHTHKPWEEVVGKTRLINPGTLAGMFYKATFAVYDTKTDKLELKILERI